MSAFEKWGHNFSFSRTSKAIGLNVKNVSFEYQITQFDVKVKKIGGHQEFIIPTVNWNYQHLKFLSAADRAEVDSADAGNVFQYMIVL